MNRRIKWVLILLAATAAVSGLLFVAAGGRPVAGQFLDRTLHEGGFGDVRIARPAPDRQTVVAGDGPGLEARIYEPEGGAEAATSAILLVHGNRPAGASNVLYRLLARRLADRGSLVLSMSLRGYGASEPAPEGRRVTAADLAGDVARGLAALRQAAPPGVPIGAVGHSLGANLVLKLEPGDTLRIVSIEPGLRLAERVVEPGAPALAQFTRKMDRHLDGGIVDQEAVRRLYGDLDPETPSGRVPPGCVLILQGRQIRPEDRESIEDSQVARPGSELVWLPSRDHEFGVVGWGPFAIYPGELTNTVSDITLIFIKTGQVPKQ